MRVGLAYPAFTGSFQRFFPELEVINPKTFRAKDYNLIIFPGGEDINPYLYGCNNTASTYNDNRDQVEKSIFYYARDAGIKMLGTCRGHQLINALLGGGLIQDLYSEGMGHSGHHGFDYRSSLEWIPERVNSMHHQGVYRMSSSGLYILATYKGVIEATANKTIISVQWHPEFAEDTRFFNFIKAWVENKVDLNLSKYLGNKDFQYYASNFKVNTRSSGEFNPFGSNEPTIPVVIEEQVTERVPNEPTNRIQYNAIPPIDNIDWSATPRLDEVVSNDNTSSNPIFIRMNAGESVADFSRRLREVEQERRDRNTTERRE